MKCKQIREVIDTTSRHTLYNDSVTTHLSGCPDCSQRAGETASLLSLLSAQHRVQAPADFDSRISQGIARAQAESLNDQTVSLLTLLKSQPRIEVPADFDFRLRARIARAEAVQVTPASFIEKAWERFARTFTLGQAATAMAAALLVATVSTFYLKPDGGVLAPTANVAANRPADQPKVEIETARGITAPVVESARIVVAKESRSAKTRPAMARYDLQAFNNQSDDFGNTEKVYSQKTKQVVKLGVSFGADAASANLAKLAADTPSF